MGGCTSTDATATTVTGGTWRGRGVRTYSAATARLARRPDEENGHTVEHARYDASAWLWLVAALNLIAGSDGDGFATTMG